jgi:hypothetical protein
MVNDDGLLFSHWHEAAGYTISFMARCDLRFFAMLHRAWRNCSNPKHWQGKAEGKDNPWN